MDINKINEEIKMIRIGNFPRDVVPPIPPKIRTCYRAITLDGKEIFIDEPPVINFKSAKNQAIFFAKKTRKPTRIQKRSCKIHYISSEMNFNPYITESADFFSDDWVTLPEVYYPED